MDTQSLAQGIRQRTTSGATRELRALALTEEHFEEIARSYHRGTYLVPSATKRGSYRVTYTRCEESCGCRDWEFGHVCKHVLAAAIVKAKTGVCSGCGSRFRHRDLTEVTEESGSLTWFVGDDLCPQCLSDSDCW